MDSFAYGGIFTAYLIWCVLCLAISAIPYVFSGLGIMGLMKRRGVDSLWMAWVPVAQQYALGKMADDILSKDAAYQKPRNNAKYILWGYIGMLGALVLYIVFMVAGAIAMDSLEGLGILLMIIAVLMLIVMLLAAILACVYYYMSYYRVLNEYKPDLAMVITVIGIFVPMLLSIFLFVIRDKDPAPKYPNPPAYAPVGGPGQYQQPPQSQYYSPQHYGPPPQQPPYQNAQRPYTPPPAQPYGPAQQQPYSGQAQQPPYGQAPQQQPYDRQAQQPPYGQAPQQQPYSGQQPYGQAPQQPYPGQQPNNQPQQPYDRQAQDQPRQPAQPQRETEDNGAEE